MGEGRKPCPKKRALGSTGVSTGAEMMEKLPQTTNRIPCRECGQMILPATVERNDGLCAPCAKTPEWLRREAREFSRRLTSGEWFMPSEAERASANTPPELRDPAAVWRSTYSDGESATTYEILTEAWEKPEGMVLLQCGDAYLVLAFNPRWGVCAFRNFESGEDRYAYTSANLRSQVAADQHLDQPCPCCGVGIGQYPSRFHLPRESAFRVFSSIALREQRPLDLDIKWLDTGDISRVEPGRG
jgi:hypothetical protein